MADPELPRDVARPHSVVRQLDDPLPHYVGQGTPVHEHAAQLVHAAVAYKRQRANKVNSTRLLNGGETRGQFIEQFCVLGLESASNEEQ